MLEEIVQSLSRYQVVLEPDENTPEWWAGAPSVARATDGTFYLAARMREGYSPKGRRGYEIRILRSHDGVRFETIKRLTREEAGVPGFERPALVFDPRRGLFKLYACAGLDWGWSILKFEDATNPQEFDAKSAKVLLKPEDTREQLPQIGGYKDPFVIQIGGLWHLFVIGYARVERAYHFISEEGETWRLASPTPVMPNSGWHDFYTRPACILPLSVGYLFVYEGSNCSWHDPVYNIATGLAFAPDLQQFIDLTPNAPLLKSTTAGQYHTWRYSHWLQVGAQIYVYFEAACPNNTNELRFAMFAAGADP